MVIMMPELVLLSEIRYMRSEVRFMISEFILMMSEIKWMISEILWVMSDVRMGHTGSHGPPVRTGLFEDFPFAPPGASTSRDSNRRRCRRSRHHCSYNRWNLGRDLQRMEIEKEFTTVGILEGSYNGWNMGRELQRMYCGEGFTTDRIWGASYNGWSLGRDLQRMEFGEEVYNG